MANDINAFLGKLEKAPKLLNDAKKQSVTAGALVITTAVRAEIHRVAPAGRMKGVGRSGAAIGAAFTLNSGERDAALVFARGPLHLLERNTQAHTISPHRAKTARGRKGASVLRIPNADPKMMFRPGPIPHPGTKGKHPFEHGVDRGRALVPEAMRRSVHSNLAKVFTG